MITVSLDPKGKKALILLEHTNKNIRRGIRDAFYEIGRENKRFLSRQILKRNKTGRLYNFRGRLHRASAAGEFPANRSGRLRRGIDYKLRGSSQMEFGVEAYYGKFLEDGTRKMKPRKLVLATAEARQRETVNSLLHHTGRRIKG